MKPCCGYLLVSKIYHPRLGLNREPWVQWQARCYTNRGDFIAVSRQPSAQPLHAGATYPVGYLRLLLQHIRSFYPYLETFSAHNL
jgi:hypothetical protein